jgi:hypothetical protein
MPDASASALCRKRRNSGSASSPPAAKIDLRRVPCACPSGTEWTGQCNYGRYCATLSARGQDVGTTLIGEGLAEPYVCTKTSCPPRKDWCRS